VFGDYLDPEQARPFAKELRRAGRALGAVRDLDVMREKTSVYLNTLPPDRSGDLTPLLTVLDIQYMQARQNLLAYLDDARYRKFKEAFSAYLQTPLPEAPVISTSGEFVPYRLRHVAPMVLYQRLAAVRAYEDGLSRPDVPLKQYHQLRIAGKWLRYAIEFFQEVLEPEAAARLIRQVKSLQDHLGDLQDAVVASELLRDFLMWGTWGPSSTSGERPTTLVMAPGVASYLAFRQAEIQRLVSDFPPVWERIRAEIKHLTLQAISAL
jgi:CHAD domain-containing protein